MREYNLFATCAFGLDKIVKRELNSLGIDAKIDNNKIYFKGDLSTICEANLWLRCADHIKIELARFNALTFEELFQGVKQIPWEDFIPLDGNFIVDGGSVKSKLFSISDCQSITEKAIIERLKLTYKGVEVFSKTGARYKIKVDLYKDNAIISLDTTGESLHKRGYRTNQKAAPIKETLAAGMVLLSFYRPNRFLFDPFAGSGTILIEAAMIAKNMAPGLDRNFDFEEWNIPKEIMQHAKIKARKESRPNLKLNLLGSDTDKESVYIARENIMNVGLSEDIKITHKDFRDVELLDEYGVLITNPPYGKRIGEVDEIRELMKDLAERIKKLPTWSFYIITSDEDFEANIGIKADRKRKFYNGNIRTDYYQFYGKRPPKE